MLACLGPGALLQVRLGSRLPCCCGCGLVHMALGSKWLAQWSFRRGNVVSARLAECVKGVLQCHSADGVWVVVAHHVERDQGQGCNQP
jgi:hypothetical protein